MNVKRKEFCRFGWNIKAASGIIECFFWGEVSPHRGYFALRPQYAAPPSAPSPRPLPSRGGGGKVGPFRNSNPHAEANTGVSHGQNLRFFPL